MTGASPSSTDTRVSVVIPCFNAGATLGAAIESALAQAPAEVEIIVVDDGSTDDSLELARKFAPAVRVLSGPNRGVSAARNRGIAESSGAWLVFLDADDLLLPGSLRTRLEMAEATGADVILCDWQELYDRNGSVTDGAVKSVDMAALAADAEIACATHTWASTAALMYRRSLVERIKGFREDLPVIQDARFLFDAAYFGARFARSSHIGARYRILSGSLSRRDPARFSRDIFTNGKQIEACWRARRPLSRAQREALTDVFNSAAAGLFRAADPVFQDVLTAMRASRIPVKWRNRLAEIMLRTIGQPGAARTAASWTRLRRALTPSARGRNLA